MSSSRSRATPVDYMQRGGPNVLWEMSVANESDGAFHHGADIGQLSQHVDEAEVLYPPLTMLIVQRKQLSAGEASSPKTPNQMSSQVASSSPRLAGTPAFAADDRSERGKQYLNVRARPCFV